MSRTTIYQCRHTTELLPTTVSMKYKDRYHCVVCLKAFSKAQILDHVKQHEPHHLRLFGIFFAPKLVQRMQNFFMQKESQQAQPASYEPSVLKLIVKSPRMKDTLVYDDRN